MVKPVPNPGMSHLQTINPGFYFTDGGAALGVLPRVMWEKSACPDERHRIRMAQNLLVIQSEEKHILVDTGLGNRLDDKTRHIYSPEAYRIDEELARIGLSRSEIDIVVFTHLHFDHVGGLISSIDGHDEFTFPNAQYYIQRTEWEIARNPDELNRASYFFAHQIAPLADSERLVLVDGDFALTPEVTLVRLNGHSNGFQGVRYDNGEDLAWYPGDLIPMHYHKRLSVTFSYDVNRSDTVAAKIRIMNELSGRKGLLYYSHDPDIPFERIG
jgi:glyoxylase-like metal-dependent hydrolase (beta-lactamase superfamily II)